MIAGMFCLPIVDALSKLVTTDYAAEQITFVRNLIHALVALPLVLYRESPKAVFRHLNALQFLRGLFFVGMTVTYVFALRWMPIADALATTFAFPFVIVLLSPWLLGERPGLRRWVAVIAGFVGICFIIRPGVGIINPGLPFAIAAMFCTAGYVLLTRMLAGTAPSLVMMFLPALVASATLATYVPIVWVTPAALDWVVMIAIGVFAALAHYLIVLAYRFGQASQIAPLTYVQMVFAVAFGYAIFGDLPDLWVVTGIVLIVSGCVFIAWREHS
ncbi:MAG: DMT family transporter [Pseudomonadota bacterium]